MEKYKIIGNVKLNLDFYSGEDKYSDGDIEDKMLELAMNNDESTFNAIIGEDYDWSVMYHFSHIRQNIVSIVDIDKSMSVLEIGSGCGAITGALADKAGKLTCVDLSQKRSLINAYRNRERDNIEIIVGNFQDIESSLDKYDCITLIGVFEYADAYINSENPYVEFLNIVKKHLNDNGKLIIAIENKLGLKYFAGCKEDHFGTYFEGIEGYSNTSGVKTFAKRELAEILRDAGFDKHKFYYPYPDYKMAQKIFSDEFLPFVGELNSNAQNFDRERMLLFDESKVFNSLIKEGLFSEYSNSFLVIAKTTEIDEKVIYEKVSNDRAEAFSIATRIVKAHDEKLEVRKYAVSKKSVNHIENILKWSEALSEQYNGSKISVCKSVLKNNEACSDFAVGKTLEDTVDKYIQSGQLQKAENIIRDYINEIVKYNSKEEFRVTPEFVEVFGDVYLEGEYKSGSVNDIDMVLNNIVDTDTGWILIDYEWTFDFPVPVEFIIYRLLHYFTETNNSREAIKNIKFFDASENDIKAFAQMEINFQKYVKGNRNLVRELYAKYGKERINVSEVLKGNRNLVSVYKNTGAGYSENERYDIPVISYEPATFNVVVPVEENVKGYRIDVCETACMLKINSVKMNGGIKIEYTTNGTLIADNTYIYSQDPWLEINVENTIIEEIHVDYTLSNKFGNCYEKIIANMGIDAVLAENNALRQEINDCRTQVTNMLLEKEEVMKSLSWRVTKPLRKVKRGLRKVKQLIKRILKSNKYTHAICKKAKAIIRGEKKEAPGIEKVSDIINVMCPKDEWNRQRNTTFDKDITFSILVPLYNTPERFLREMIESVQYQTYPKWELCLADGSDDEHGEVGRICKEYIASDNRIKYEKLTENKGISGNTNACIDMATGNYIALFDHDDFLHPCVLFENMKAICKTGADYLYTDEATFQGTNIFNIITKHCKPDFAIDNLRANNYICHFSVFASELLEKAGRFRPEYDGSQDHDMILRLTDAAEKVYHIRKILYYWRSHPNSVASDISAKTYAIDAAKRAVQAHLERVGMKAEVESSRAFPTIFRFKYELTATPKVSVIIPNCNHFKDLKKCISSILEKSMYNNYEIIIIDNNSYKNDIFDYYKELEKDARIKVVKYEGEFNYAKINNFGVKAATGDYLILLNNDTEVISEAWIEELLMYAQREDVGVVGAKLYYPDDTIQHAGVVIGLGAHRAAGHIHYGVDKDNVGYMGKLFYAQNVSAVTGACMMIKKSLYNELGGLEEEFTVAFNDVDLCLKAREKGYLNIFTPYCELYHYESKSRGLEDTTEKKERFLKEVDLFKERWHKVIEDGDPYYNPNFSLDRADYYIPE